MSINQYKIQKKVGKGNFATVYKAIDRSTSRTVAIKIFSKRLTAIEEQLANKEVTILKQVDHPKIIRLYNQFRSNDTWYMIFEFCGKGDLQQLLKRKGRISEETVSLIAIDLSQALAQLQKMNIAHRDIKLANILVNDEFEIKLADLGFAKVSQGEDVLKSYAGTPLIMAPQIFQRGQYTNKCDIWSFGVILYQMLFGVVPFLPTNRQAAMQDLIYLVKNKAIEFPKDVPVSAEAKDFISKCLQKQPNKRISAQAMKKHPWIIKAKGLNMKLANVLSKLYIQDSGIFNMIEREEDDKFDQFDDNRMIEREFTDSLKRTLAAFEKSYISSVQNFQRSYRQLDRVVSEKSSNPKASKTILEQILFKKILQMQNFNFQILENPNQKIVLTIDDFKHARTAAEHLKKSITPQFKLQNDSFERELIRTVTTILAQHSDVMGKNKCEELIRNLIVFLQSSFNNYKLDLKISFTLKPDTSQLANTLLKHINKPLICKLFVTRRQESIPLMDVVEFDLKMPQATFTQDEAFYLEALNVCFQEKET